MKRDIAPAVAETARIADEKVLVLDFGSQYAQLIARRVREQQRLLRDRAARYHGRAGRGDRAEGIILSGGPASVYEPRRRKCDPAIFRSRHSGAGHLLRHATGLRGAGRQGRKRAGPRVWPGSRAGDCRTHDLFAGVPDEIEVWMSHGDQVSRVSDDFVPLAAHATCPIAAVKHTRLPIYGLQFHPEVTHTPRGTKILANFLTNVCGCTGTWQLGDFAEQTIERRSAQRVGDRPRDLRTVRRRRFVGRRGAAVSSDRAAVVVHPGRQRPAAEGRSGIGDPRVHEALSAPTCTSCRPRSEFLTALAGVTDPAGKAAADRPRVHRLLSRPRRPRSRARTFSPRARSIPT